MARKPLTDRHPHHTDMWEIDGEGAIPPKGWGEGDAGYIGKHRWEILSKSTEQATALIC